MRKVVADGPLLMVSAGLADEARVRPAVGSNFERPPVVVVVGSAGEPAASDTVKVRPSSLTGGSRAMMGSPVSARAGSGVAGVVKTTVFSTLRLSPAVEESSPSPAATFAPDSAGLTDDALVALVSCRSVGSGLGAKPEILLLVSSGPVVASGGGD